MKIADAEVIKGGETDLIDAITADIDWEGIEEIFRRDHKLGIDEEVEYKRGDIVVYGDRVAYKLEFAVRVSLSVLLDREGNYISVTSSADLGAPQPKDDGGQDTLETQETNVQEKISAMASQVGEMITETENESQIGPEKD
jgi:hypothetical protein